MTGTDTATQIESQSQKVVVVVDGHVDLLQMFEFLLAAGRHDMVFVESVSHACAQIKTVRPNLVVVCARLDRLESFQFLTTVKLDPDTRDIPVLTYPVDGDGDTMDETMSRRGGNEALASTELRTS